MLMYCNAVRTSCAGSFSVRGNSVDFDIGNFVAVDSALTKVSPRGLWNGETTPFTFEF